MGHHKKIWLEQCKGPGVLFYSNYVDDTFCLFPSEDNTTTFLSYINSWHPNICFAMEKKIDCVLPFLDVLIDITDPHSIITGIFHYFFHFPPMLHKIGVVRTLIIRVFEINNTWLGFHDDIKKLVLILCINVFLFTLLKHASIVFHVRQLSGMVPLIYVPPNTNWHARQYVYKLLFLGYFLNAGVLSK